MKKLLSILMLLVAIVTGAQAADYSAPATKKYGDITFLDVAATDANVTVGNDNYLTYGAYYIGCTLKVTTWYNCSDGSPASNKDNGVEGDFSGQGFIKVTTTKQDDTNGNASMKLHKDRIRYYYVTGATSVAGLVKDAGSTKYTQLQIQEVTADGTLGTATTIDGNKSTSQYVINGGDLDASKYYKISFTSNDKSNCYIYQVRFGKAPSKTVATQAFAGVKQGDATLKENTDYTVDGTTITLTNSATMAPEDIKLINHITYTDESTADTDVDVTLEKNEAGDYFEGTATIGLTTYTVKVPVDATPTLEADKTALEVNSPKVATGTATFNLTGANLAGENVTLAFASAVEGLTVSPASIAIAEGSVEQTVTVSYKSTEDVAEAVVNLVVSTEGVSDITIPVTYSSTAGITTITDVTACQTWDFSQAGSADIASPDQNNNIPLANATGWKEGFNYEALSGKGQYFYYKSYNCYQGSELKFHTTVPGKVTVEFSNTGNRDDKPENYRYLYINGTKVGEGTITSKTHNTVEDVAVEAGDVVLEGFQGEGTSTPNMLRFFSITFTPTATINLNAKGYATYSSKYDFTFEGAQAYKMALNESAKTIAGTEVTSSIKAGEGILFKGEPNAEVTITGTTGATALEGNSLIGSTQADGSTAAKPTNCYTLSGDTFKKFTGDALVANKAFFATTSALAVDFDIVFDEGEATAVDAIAEADEAKAAPVKIIKNGKLYIGNFNVAGQQVK